MLLNSKGISRPVTESVNCIINLPLQKIFIITFLSNTFFINVIISYFFFALDYREKKLIEGKNQPTEFPVFYKF